MVPRRLLVVPSEHVLILEAPVCIAWYLGRLSGSTQIYYAKLTQ